MVGTALGGITQVTEGDGAHLAEDASLQAGVDLFESGKESHRAREGIGGEEARHQTVREVLQWTLQAPATFLI